MRAALCCAVQVLAAAPNNTASAKPNTENGHGEVCGSYCCCLTWYCCTAAAFGVPPHLQHKPAPICTMVWTCARLPWACDVQRTLYIPIDLQPQHPFSLFHLFRASWPPISSDSLLMFPPTCACINSSTPSVAFQRYCMTLPSCSASNILTTVEPATGGPFRGSRRGLQCDPGLVGD